MLLIHPEQLYVDVAKKTLRKNPCNNMIFIIPANSIVDIAIEVIEPTTALSGLRASRDLAQQIIGKLDSMEKGYFAKKYG